MIRTPHIQPQHSLELSYVELEILAKKALFRFSNIDIEPKLDMVKNDLENYF